MDFNTRLNDKHSGNIKLLSTYTNMRSKVTLECGSCGNIYHTTAKTALASGCPKCSRTNKGRLGFITKALAKHGDKYDYDKVVYTNNHTEVVITCPQHGIFSQKPTVHYRSGCPTCSIKKLTTKTFIDKSKGVHGDIYNYDHVIYTQYNEHVTIICDIHGEFSQTPSNHLHGYGCKQCGYEGMKIDPTELTNSLVELYPQFKFDDLDFKDSQSNINLTCPTHGNFKRKPHEALKGNVECGQCVKTKNQKQGLSKFKDKANAIHDNYYDYSRSVYTAYHDSICIICPKHGEFNQTVLNHLQGKGCKKCADAQLTSKPQQEIYDFIKQHYTGEVLLNQPILDGKHVDILLTDINLAIEVNGVYWHSENGGNPKSKTYHSSKSKLAHQKGYTLIHILDVEWVQKRERVMSLLKSKLQVYDQRIFGRKCMLREIDNKSYKDFCNDNHMQGYCVSSIRLGLFYQDELVSVMSFSKSRFSNHDWEMIRYCNKLNTTIIGGSQKLFKHFTKEHNGKVVSYSDVRFFDGKMYEKLGFELSHTSTPNYFYFQGYNLKTLKFESRNKYQKHKLANILDFFDNSHTEKQNMFNHGYDRIWDCGNKVWVWEG